MKNIKKQEETGINDKKQEETRRNKKIKKSKLEKKE